MPRGENAETFIVGSDALWDLHVAPGREVACCGLEEEHGLPGGVIAELLDVLRVVPAYGDYLLNT